MPENNLAKHLSWACRKGYGQSYSEIYMEKYKYKLQRMFHEGCLINTNKMNPGKMRETLMNMFPHKISIPSELKIKKIITSETQKHKNTKTAKSNNSVSERRGRKPEGTALI